MSELLLHAIEMYNLTSALLDDVAMGMPMPDGIDENRLLRVKEKAEKLVLCSVAGKESNV